MNPLTRGLYRVLWRLSRRPLPYPVRTQELLATMRRDSGNTNGEGRSSRSGNHISQPRTPGDVARGPISLPGVMYITSSRGLRDGMEVCFRSHPQSPPNIDVALNAIRKLSDIRKMEEESKLTRIINSNGTGVSGRAQALNPPTAPRFELGDVLIHTSTRQRMVCVFWRWDVTTGTQMIRAVPDSRNQGSVFVDMDVKLAGELPASEFDLCADPLLQRCEAVELDQYFSHFSPVTERLVAHPHVKYFFPGDTKGVPLAGFEEDGKVGTLRNPEKLRRDLTASAQHVLPHLRRLETELRTVFETSLLHAPSSKATDNEWRGEVLALFEFLDSRHQRDYPALFNGPSLVKDAIAKSSLNSVINASSPITSDASTQGRGSRKDAASSSSSNSSTKSGATTTSSTANTAHSNKSSSRVASLLKSLETVSETWMASTFGSKEFTESCLMLGSHAHLFTMVSRLLVHRYQHNLTDLVPLLTAANQRMVARRKASGAFQPHNPPPATASHRSSAKGTELDDATVVRSIDRLFNPCQPSLIAPGDVVKYKGDERERLFVCVSTTRRSLKGDADALMWPLFSKDNVGDESDEEDDDDEDSDSDSGGNKSAFVNALRRIAEGLGHDESATDASFDFALASELDRVDAVSASKLRKGRLNDVLQRMFVVNESDIASTSRLRPRLHLAYMSGADISNSSTSSSSDNSRSNSTSSSDTELLKALDATIADVFVVLHDFLFRGMVHDNENVEPLLDLNVSIEQLRKEALRECSADTASSTSSTSTTSTTTSSTGTTTPISSSRHSKKHEAPLRLSEVKFLMRNAAKSVEAEMVVDFLRNVDFYHPNFGMSMMIAMHDQFATVDSGESALEVLNEVVSLDPGFIHAALIRDRQELLLKARSGLSPVLVSEEQLRRAVAAVEARPSDHMVWYHLASMASLTKKCSLTVGLVAMARALALHPWFKEVRMYDFMHQNLRIEGTEEEKALVRDLFASPAASAVTSWADLQSMGAGRKDKTTLTDTTTTSKATQSNKTTSSSGSDVVNDSSADEVNSTTSEASGDGDAWFRSIKK